MFLAMKDQGTHLLCNHIICTWQRVRVVHGDVHIRSFAGRPVTVKELIQHHPHHFVCNPTSNGPVSHGGMLPFDMELEEGRMYLLLPLPKLIPHLASTFPSPPSCPCFSNLDSIPGSGSDSAGFDHRVWKAVNEEPGFKVLELVYGEPRPDSPGCSQENSCERLGVGYSSRSSWSHWW